jgi:hypothetical protein
MPGWLGFCNREGQLSALKEAKVETFPSFSLDFPILRQRLGSNSTSVSSNPPGQPTSAAFFGDFRSPKISPQYPRLIRAITGLSETQQGVCR